MKIVVIGVTGLIGSNTVAILREEGHDVVAGSPKSGVNTITGCDEDGAGVQDFIGTRCGPDTNLLLKGAEYYQCCHSNLTRVLATERNLSLKKLRFMWTASPLQESPSIWM